MGENPYQVIRNNYPGYSRTFRKIADYILKQPDAVLRLNIRQLAGQIDAAESSIVRFCKENGFSGFSELKILLAKYGRRQTDIIYESLQGKSPEENSQDIFSMNIETLQIARDQMDFTAIDALTDQVCQAGRCVICGVGASASMAESFALHLLRIGIPARAETDGEIMQMLARTADAQTLFIAISKGGRTLPVVRAFEIARAHGAATACLTGSANTPLGALCDVQVVHYCPTTLLMNCRIVQNTIIDCVYINAAQRCRAEAEQIYRENRAALEQLYV